TNSRHCPPFMRNAGRGMPSHGVTRLQLGAKSSMTASLEKVDQYLTGNSSRFLEELKAFLRIPSISADSRHKDDVRQAARFVVSQMQGAGLTAELVETAGHPICYGHSLHAAGAPTVLVYGHYDVQPPDPLDQWVTPPFEPTIRDGCLFARGATDDKGQV